MNNFKFLLSHCWSWNDSYKNLLLVTSVRKECYIYSVIFVWRVNDLCVLAPYWGPCLSAVEESSPSAQSTTTIANLSKPTEFGRFLSVPGAGNLKQLIAIAWILADWLDGCHCLVILFHSNTAICSHWQHKRKTFFINGIASPMWEYNMFWMFVRNA